MADDAYATPDGGPIAICRGAWRMLRAEGPRGLAAGVGRFFRGWWQRARWRLWPPAVRVADHRFRIRHRRARIPFTTELHLLHTVARASPFSTVWDVGANVGIYSLVAVRHGAHVVAFEPDRENREVFDRLLDDWHHHVDLCPVALSDESGERPWVGDVESGKRRIEDDDGATDTVTVRRGDGLGVPQPDGVKIDVEGHEVAVLDGMVETLQEVDWVVIEVHVETYDVDEDAVIERLDGAGLEVVDRQLRNGDVHLVADRGGLV